MIERDLVLHQQDLVQSWHCNTYLLPWFVFSLKTVFFFKTKHFADNHLK